MPNRSARRNMLLGAAIGSSRAKRRAAATAPTPVPTPATPAAPAAETDTVVQLRQLKALVDEGILTDDEFQAKKKQLLGL